MSWADIASNRMKRQTLGLALTSMLGLFVARAAESPTLVLGNGFNRTVSYQSVTSADTVGSALLYGPEQMQIYKGCRLTEIHVDLGALAGSDTVRVFVGHSPTGKPLYEGLFKQQKTGWNTFRLDSALTLDGSALCVGYEVTGVRLLRYSNTLVAGEEWLRKNNERGWQRYDDDYSASLYATLEGDVPRRNLVLGTTVMPSYARTGEAMAFSGQFANLGADTIRSLTFALLADGQRVATATVDGLGVAPRKRGTFALDQFSLPSEGDYGVAIEATEVNGGADVSPADNRSRTVSLLCRERFARRKVLMEVFSTEKCTGCPAGHRTIANVLGGKDDIIEVGHHAGFYTDTLTVDASVAYEWFYKEGRLYAPAVMFDRTSFAGNYPTAYADGVPVAGVETGNLQAGYAESAATPAHVALGVEPLWDASTRRLTVTVDGSQLLPLPQPDSVRLNVFLTEDSVFSTTQRNSEGSFFHRFVLRQTLTPTWGEPVDAAQGFRRSFGVTIPREWDERRLQVVAFVANHDATDKTNCRVYNAEACFACPSATSLVQLKANARCARAKRRLEGNVELPHGVPSLCVYDLQGRLVRRLDKSHPQAHLSRGIYIIM